MSLSVMPVIRFECLFCLKTYSSKLSLMNHIRLHLNERPFSCNKCEKQCIFLAELSRHLLAVHKKFDCEICGDSLTGRNALKLHSKKHKKLHYCTHCPKSFSLKSVCNTHIRDVHLYEEVKCSICNTILKSDKFLKGHMQSHTNEKPYKCLVCGKFYTRAYGLKLHLKTHGVERKRLFPCSVCNKAFFSRSNLYTHEQRHIEGKFFTCIICEKQFKNLKILSDHCHSHTKEKPFNCEKCKSEFSHQSTVALHKRVMHEKQQRYKCEICSRRFGRKHHLDDHLATHLKEQVYKCTICGQRYRHLFGFKCHMDRHTNRNNEPCPRCPHQFISLTQMLNHYLKIHLGSSDDLLSCVICGKRQLSYKLLEEHTWRKHTREKPHFCHICPKIFVTENGLKRHAKVHSENS